MLYLLKLYMFVKMLKQIIKMPEVFDNKYFIQASSRVLKNLKLYKILSLGLLASFYCTCSFAQFNGVQLKHISIEQGLSNNIVRCIIQDKDGYMWFGTNDGLNRFDGYTNVVYKKKINDNTTLCDNWIISLFVDSHKNLWVGTQAGVNLYNPVKDNFVQFIVDTVRQQINFANKVVRIIEDSKNDIYLTTEIGDLYRFDRKLEKFVRIEKTFPQIRTFIIDKDGRFWLGTIEGIVVYDNKTGEMHSYTSFTENGTSQPLNIIFSLYEEGDTIWIGNNHGKVLYTLKDDVNFKRLIFPAKNSFLINEINKRRNGLIYISDNIGIHIYNKKDNTFESITYNEFNKNGLNSEGVTSIYEDRLNNLWIGTVQGGVNLAVSGKAFTNINKYSKPALDILNISTICEDSKDNLWVGSFNIGVNSINYRTFKKQLYLNNPNDPNSLAYGTVHTIFEDHQKNMWFGTYIGYLQKLDAQTNKFISYKFSTSNKYALDGRDIRSLAEDKEGNLYIISHGSGLIKFNPSTGSYNVFKYDGGNVSGSFADDWSYQVYIDKTGIIWAATPSGLSRLDPKTETFSNYYPILSDSNSLSHKMLHVIFEDSNNILWIGTGFGLNAFNKTNNKFYRFYDKDGLPSNDIKSILEHKTNELWISTASGICRLRYNIEKDGSVKVKSFRSYNKSDNLQDNYYWDRSACKLKNGKLAFGGENGIVVFNPDEIKDNTEIPNVYITDFKIFGKSIAIGEHDSILHSSISNTKEIKLKSKFNSFSFSYIALNYISTENNEYAYKMEGFDKDWIYAGYRREATYTNLDPGNYYFKVKASNNDKYWNEEGVTLKITILPPLLETWWFRILAIIIIVGLALFYYLDRIGILKKQNVILEKKVHERTKQLTKVNEELGEMNNWILTQNEEISAQNQEIYNKNEEISIQKDMLEEQKNNVEMAYIELTQYRTKLEEIVEERTKELVESKEKAEESDRLKSSFLANLSHEIRTPLNSIIGFSNMIFDTDISDEERLKFKSIIESSSNTLLSLINDIIDFSKIEAGHLEIVMKEINLGHFFETLKDTYDLEVKKQLIGNHKHLDFRIATNETINALKIKTDEVRLRQVLTNLINNAIKFTNEGYIEVGCNILKDKNLFEFYVKDTGIGIREEHQQLIFERFRKVEDDKSNLYRGAGLGLAISQHLVRLMGGEIHVKSTLSEGSTFVFTLPFDNSISSVSHNKFGDSTIPILENISILVAEDDYANFEYLDRLLRKTKAKVYHAINGLRVLEIVSKYPDIRLILMDIKMPEMNGIEALNELRKRNINIITIAQTAYYFSEELRKLIDQGFDDYIEKPVKPKEFYSIISKHLILKT
jgi:signal transduction histidine kinase/ligand-binding sensor domain-containing protein/CheY-like chemotaxis protein